MLPWFQFNIIQLGPLTLQVWGLFVALGMVLAFVIMWFRGKKLGLDVEDISSHALWMIIGGLIGARLVHVIFYEPAFYIADPLELLKVWHGGLSSFGGIFGAAVAYFGYAKKNKISKHDLLQRIDFISYAALYGWIVGRIGCFMIHDHMGKPCDCFFAINTPDGPRLEMAFLEILGLIPLAIVFFVVRKKKLPKGWYMSVLFIYYGILRFILDFFRATDIASADVRYFGLTPGQYSAIVLLIIGIYFYKKQVLKNK